MTKLLHADNLSIQPAGEYLSSPLYSVIGEHIAALLAIALLPLVLWAYRRLRNHATTPTPLDPSSRMLFWLLAASAAAHVGLVIGHEPSVLSALFLADSMLLGMAANGVAKGEPSYRFVRWVLSGSLLAFAVSSFSGEVPDQVALFTKLLELTALTIVLTPLRPTLIRRLASSAGAVTMVVLVGTSSWVGAFGATEGGHHLGEVPQPGVLLPVGTDREATDAEAQAADLLHAETVAGVARFADSEVAAAAGYDVEGIAGLDFHAGNEQYKHDGRVLDPERPENLIYAAGPDGPVLVGVMYEMEDIGVAGPAIGGPLTVWHAHNQICFGVVPPALAGLRSPFGSCPVGSITMPVTGEMLHVFVAPGAPDRFGHLDEDWLNAFVAGTLTADG